MIVKYITLILLIPIDILRALLHLIYSMYDLTHYYISDINVHIISILKICNIYLQAIPRHVYIHFYHHQYLRNIGFANCR
jgi:hypothetical protein